MTTEKGGESLCKWSHKLLDCNVCLISGKDIEEATRIEYCVGNWRECELYLKEKRLEPIEKVRLGD